jgi:hypothetical protein
LRAAIAFVSPTEDIRQFYFFSFEQAWLSTKIYRFARCIPEALVELPANHIYLLAFSLVGEREDEQRGDLIQ